MIPKTFVRHFLTSLLTAILNQRHMNRKQIAVTAMVTDLLDYADGEIDEHKLECSVTAFKTYVALYIERAA